MDFFEDKDTELNYKVFIKFPLADLR